VKIPLVFNANPSIISKRALSRIPLDQGKWRIIMENLIDSRLNIHYGPPSGFFSFIPLVNNMELILNSPSVVFLSIEAVGSEKAFSIYIERM